MQCENVKLFVHQIVSQEHRSCIEAKENVCVIFVDDEYNEKMTMMMMMINRVISNNIVLL